MMGRAGWLGLVEDAAWKLAGGELLVDSEFGPTGRVLAPVFR